MTVHEPRQIHWRGRYPSLFPEGSVVLTLLVLAVGLAVFGMIAIARKLHASQMPDYLSPQVLMRINTDYSELPQ
jgi:hypothetical protein